MLKSLKGEEAKKISKEEAYLILTYLLKEEINLVIRKMRSEDSFESAAWSEKQAYSLGLLKAFDKVIQLLPDQGK